MKIKVINGPNLNLLGIREKQVYGDKTYKDLVEMIEQYCFVQNIEVSIIQSNHEGTIIDEIQQSYFDHYDAIIINPGAYTHYSYAIRDALSSIDVMKIEVHLSNIYEREDFRKVNVIKDVVNHSVFGHGFNSYIEAIQYLHHHLI
jgi:3-dehydroquinate dehydratase II